MTLLRTVLVKGFWLLCFTLLFALYLYHKALQEPLALPEEGLVLDIQRGETLHHVLRKLESEAHLPSVLVARVYSRINGFDARIRAGEFALQPGLTIPDLFALISSNQQIRYAVTLVEGQRFSEVRDTLHRHPKLTQTLLGQSDEAVRGLLKAPALKAYQHPEGLLYPDTYFFRKGDTDLDILQRAHTRLAEVLVQEWSSRADALPLTSPYEALILASIVEKETGVPEERAEIAGVFVRRLQKGMRLQTDPTVIYGLGDRYKGNIKRTHLREHTPYNTYRINGLPPTPIALAGREAIHAALHPKPGSSLYFVARGDGSHVFSDTIDAHNRAVRQYQLNRRDDYRSVHRKQSDQQ